MSRLKPRPTTIREFPHSPRPDRGPAVVICHPGKSLRSPERRDDLSYKKCREHRRGLIGAGCGRSIARGQLVHFGSGLPFVAQGQQVQPAPVEGES